MEVTKIYSGRGRVVHVIYRTHLVLCDYGIDLPINGNNLLKLQNRENKDLQIYVPEEFRACCKIPRPSVLIPIFHLIPNSMSLSLATDGR